VRALQRRRHHLLGQERPPPDLEQGQRRRVHAGGDRLCARVRPDSLGPGPVLGPGDRRRNIAARRDLQGSVRRRGHGLRPDLVDRFPAVLGHRRLHCGHAEHDPLRRHRVRLDTRVRPHGRRHGAVLG
jgi:hypothetical protein